MIEIISSWAKSLGVAIVLVSILEMVLPNNKTKKYIRMVMGIFVIFNIISPFIKNKENLSLASINIESYYTEESGSNITDSGNLNQASMDERIKELYQDELEKDIIKKVEEQGYEVLRCKVEAEVPTNESSRQNSYENGSQNETGISKIELKIDGKVESENNNDNNETQEQEENIENKIITGVQRIKEVDISKDEEKNQEQNTEENNNKEEQEQTNKKVTRSDIQNIKKFLIEEYGVSEKCLEIN